MAGGILILYLNAIRQARMIAREAADRLEAQVAERTIEIQKTNEALTEQITELKQRLVVSRKQDGRCCYDPQAKRELIAPHRPFA
jgi:C4-dicarboxylate-specific signal transduction histidine kinase